MTVRTSSGIRSPGWWIAAVISSFGRAVGELLVIGVQIGQAARKPLVTIISRHEHSSPIRSRQRAAGPGHVRRVGGAESGTKQRDGDPVEAGTAMAATYLGVDDTSPCRRR